MPRITDITNTPAPGLDIPGPLWLREALDQQLDAGKSFLVAGTAGIGKSTMTLQLLGALSSQGIKTLYLPSEQTPDAVKRTVERLFGPEMPSAIAENLHIDTILDLAALPLTLPAQLTRPQGEYYGTRVVAIDSLQSAGLGTQMDTKYCALKQLIKWARKAGIVLILVSHVTKDGKIAGPKDLEHEVDAVIYLRRAFRLRALTVPKYRDHRVVLDPIMLTMTERGLEESPHAAAHTGAAMGYCGKFVEAQATVSIPQQGVQPKVNSPFLVSKRIQQLIKVLGGMKDVDLVGYDVSCYMPGRRGYVADLDLAIVTAILSSYLHQPARDKALFLGEVDLAGKIRPPGRDVLVGLAATIVKSQPGEIRTVYLAKKAAEELKEMRVKHKGAKVGDVVDVKGVRDLEELVRELWPGVVGEEEREEPVGEFEPAGCTVQEGAEEMVS